MSKIAVIYWSGTGNTEAMADLVASAAAAAGASVDKFTASEFNTASAGDYTGFALGCPAMGAEQLEESEFEPMYQALRGSLSGKPVGLFGSYGWRCRDRLRSLGHGTGQRLILYDITYPSINGRGSAAPPLFARYPKSACLTKRTEVSIF